MLSCRTTAEEVSFERSHHRISSTDSKVRTTLDVSIIYSGSERVNVFGIECNGLTRQKLKKSCLCLNIMSKYNVNKIYF